ncbi:photosystem II repair protein Psb32 [Cyanobium sp. WAJ14-Wanaka]|uniref:photosystem II repair protein Psb32 n=1 Tax=Cyanobium sp. WAJ14-Wanaka TaxID=2823725 RepID=UPI0020CD2F92|nr:TPM domain-containing protein [Cyanobium sp. WAJ14-Wanaka]MCP9774560.1 TPM domain-containing protein [Cyanobium sp. WAJ14-Wanaka]
MFRSLRPWLAPLLGLLVGILLLPTPSLAVSVSSLPAVVPEERVIDTADVLSRAGRADVSDALRAFNEEHVDAHLITVKRLDYGLSLDKLANQLLQTWLQAGAEDNQLLFLIETQTNTAAVVESPGLEGQLNSGLLTSTARTTFGQPIREGGRYRQGSLDGIGRLLTVLQGSEDPGEPAIADINEVQVTNIPSKEETSESNAFTWIIVLLVAGTIVPMLTWWFFSR